MPSRWQRTASSQAGSAPPAASMAAYACSLAPGSRTPRRYNCQPDLALEQVTVGSARQPRERTPARAASEQVRPRFESEHYGTPNYARLVQSGPVEIARGADDESEMGVFHDLEPQRAADQTRLDEYMLAGFDAGIIYAS